MIAGARISRSMTFVTVVNVFALVVAKGFRKLQRYQRVGAGEFRSQHPLAILLVFE